LLSAPSPFEAEFRRHIAISFRQGDFEELKRRLLRHGATLIDPERPTPFARLFFRNPDGYVFEVVAAEREPEAAAPVRWHYCRRGGNMVARVQRGAGCDP
jgi:hypothetical protein